MKATVAFNEYKQIKNSVKSQQLYAITSANYMYHDRDIAGVLEVELTPVNVPAVPAEPSLDDLVVDALRDVLKNGDSHDKIYAAQILVESKRVVL